MSKKWILLSVVAVFVVGGWFVVTNSNLLAIRNIWRDGQKEVAIRGDLVIPVAATGSIVAFQRIQIKSKASGVVEDIPVVEGQMVKKGDILIRLDPVDENRNVEARQADLDRATSGWKKAKIVLERQRLDLPLQTKLAEARLQDAEARLKEAEFRFNRVKHIGIRSTSEQELVTAEMTYATALAARNIAQTNLEQAKIDETTLLQSAQEDVVQAEATMESTEKVLEESRQRLEETEVRARSSGMVFSIQVRKGETIQSGMSSFAGGTQLMTLVDISSIFVIAQIDEADIGTIREIAPNYARPVQTQNLGEAEYIQRAEKIIAAADNDKNEDDPNKYLIGRPVKVTVDAYRSHDYQGVIERILPEAIQNNNTVSFGVRIRMMGDDLEKLIGLQADLSFDTKTHKNVVLVKNEALASEGRECFVYVPYRKSSRDRWDERKVPVKIGETDGTYTEIMSGIQAGEEVWIKRPQLTDKERRSSSGSA